MGRVKVRANRKVKISYVIYHETFQQKSEKRKEKIMPCVGGWKTRPGKSCQSDVLW